MGANRLFVLLVVGNIVLHIVGYALVGFTAILCSNPLFINVLLVSFLLSLCFSQLNFLELLVLNLNNMGFLFSQTLASMFLPVAPLSLNPRVDNFRGRLKLKSDRLYQIFHDDAESVVD